jgi:uncharacterized protein YigA (DUF484 family)
VYNVSSQEKDRNATGVAENLGEQEVADYLRRHPQFFRDKPSLLADLRVPHDAGGAVSLVERQVAVLRDNSERQQKQLDSLIQIARDNDRLNGQLHQLTLGLMQCADLEGMLGLINNRLRQDFAADFVAICLLRPPLDEALADRPEIVNDTDAFQGAFQRLLSASKPFCGLLKVEQLALLFGEQAESVGSNALLPLGSRGELGLLAIGSCERDRFNPGADTAFLGRMAEIIAAALGPQLARPGA